VARQVVQPGEPGSKEIKLVFGDSFFSDDGSLNRKKLADHVFADKSRLKLLNSLLHPIIIDRLFELSNLHSGRVFWDVALLIQAGMQQSVDFIWLVVANEDEKIRRVTQRDGASEQSVRQRMDKQLSDEQMKPFAHEIIENNEDLSSLYNKIDTLLNKPTYNEVSE
ncbi:MAG: dephospho-CoA kinase, partial [Clostridia bacterium]|nr:dephospho-CoA kinase [Clostridia bacterium]